MSVYGTPEQEKFENLDENSKFVVDQNTGLARRLTEDGPTGDAKPLAELIQDVPEKENKMPKAKNFSPAAKKDHFIDGNKP